MSGALRRKNGRVRGFVAPHVRRVGGGHRGSLTNYRPQRTAPGAERFERETLQTRAEDLTGNHWGATSVVDAITVNTVGTGLRPQAKPNYRRLGISREAAREVAEQQEWAWKVWCREAHVSGRLFFDDLCFLGLRSSLIHGEMIHLPVMLQDSGRKFSLALQDVHPLRLQTPNDLSLQPNIRDGVELDDIGRPVAYWFADPPRTSSEPLGGFGGLSSAQFVCKPARHAHRPCVFHLFRTEENEQVRGVSKLAPGLKLFRHLDDSLDYELMAQIVTASLPVFIATDDPQGVVRAQYEQQGTEYSPVYHGALPDPGTLMYGNPGEKPHILESNRPGNNFVPFTELVLRAAAASTGMPYEVLSKDFSKTNYSSARAALLEAWRVFLLYRHWMVNHYCTALWAMVQEEACLRGYVQLPKGAPGFYEGFHAWTQSKWIGPARGYVDPVKEVRANVMALENRLTTHADIIAERGEDWEEVWEQRTLEEKRADEMFPPENTGGNGKETDNA